MIRLNKKNIFRVKSKAQKLESLPKLRLTKLALVMMLIMVGFSSFIDPVPTNLTTSFKAQPFFTTTCTIIDSEDFESGLGIWNDGGTNASYYTNTVYANSGTDYFGIRDNTGSSNVFTDQLNLTAYTSVTIDFSFITNTAIDNGDYFQLQYNIGSGWINAMAYESSVHFIENTRNNVSVTITDNFTSTTRFRFNGEMTQNNEYVYIDDVVISGCTDDCTLISFEDFENPSNIGPDWNDGGSGADIWDGNEYRGTYSADIVGTGGASGSIFTDNMNLTSYDEIIVSFYYSSNGYENGDDFFLQISSNGGSSYSNVEEYDYGEEWHNDYVYTARTLTISGPFTSTTRLRFLASGSSTNDWFNVDDITISGCSNCTPPTVSGQPNLSNCENSTFTMTQSAPGSGTGVWTVTSGSATITTASSPTTTVTGLAIGATATLRWTVTDMGCSAYDEVVITNSQQVSAVSDQPDQNGADSYTMTQSAPGIGSGIWAVVSGTATVTTPTSPTTTVTGISSGSAVVMRWTVTNGACSDFDEVILTYSAVEGIVFHDYNYNGINDAGSDFGLAGVIVEAYDDNGVLVSSTTSMTDGSYTLSGLTLGDMYRLEFSLPASLLFLEDSNIGADNGGQVQFVLAGAMAGAGFADPNAYCQPNPRWFVSCFTNGDPQHASNVGQPALVSYDYDDDDGDTVEPMGDITTTKAVEATIPSLGSVWGGA